MRWHGLMPVAAALFVTAICQAETERPMPDFSRYLPNPHLSDTIEQHRKVTFIPLPEPTSPTRQPKDLLMVITTFGLNARDELRFIADQFVSETGVTTSQRLVFDWAVQGSGPNQISARALAALKAEMGTLPAENEYPPLKELAILTYRSGSSWVTRSLHIEKANKLFLALRG